MGVLAGQAVGEPATQMTLDTFHRAGNVECSVSAGIMQLRRTYLDRVYYSNETCVVALLGNSIWHLRRLANILLSFTIFGLRRVR